MASPKIPFTKPDPDMVVAVLRTLRDQLKARHEAKAASASKKSGERSSPKDRD
jgi:hypothetical protein